MGACEERSHGLTWLSVKNIFFYEQISISDKTQIKLHFRSEMHHDFTYFSRIIFKILTEDGAVRMEGH